MTRTTPLVAAIALAAAAPAHAQLGYVFENIADTSGPIAGFTFWPAINNNGDVAFIAELDSGGEAIFLASGGELTMLADTSGPFSSFFSETPDINSDGVVVFEADLDAGGEGIFTATPDGVTTIADPSTGPGFSYDDPSISNSGAVAFTAAPEDSFTDSLYLYQDGEYTLIQEGQVGEPIVNNEDQVVFRTEINDADAIVLWDDGEITALYSEGAFFTGFEVPDINDSGIAAFIGDYEMDEQSLTGVFAGDGEGLSTIAVEDPYVDFGERAAINDVGDVSFPASLPSDGIGSANGIFTGPNPDEHTVIVEGDPLFGSEFGFGEQGSHAINDFGEIAFTYSLMSGPDGIAVALPDLDGDGLANEWEFNGIDANADGVVDLDLPAMGADPYHKDLFVEIDAMQGRVPDPAALDAVEQAFADAPVENPDGETGVNLHAMVDETDLLTFGFPNGFDEFDDVKDDRYGTAAERADPDWEHIKAARDVSFRYCIFGDTHSGTTSGGLAEFPGDDLMVTLGGWSTPGGTPDQQAGTFMHELGHNLGLHHGGGDAINRKANYYSVMNYKWQVPYSNYPSLWRLDYSSVELAPLDEAQLSETAGIDGSDPEYTQVIVNLEMDPPFNQWVPTDGLPIDWDGDGAIEKEPAQADLNYVIPDKQDPSFGQVHVGHDDWANLRYELRGHSNFADGVHSVTTLDTEITHEEFLAQQNQLPPLCLADVNGDGQLDILDFVAFQDLFQNGDPAADCDDSGTLDVLDFLCYQQLFQAGCP